jgi:hypothetical protein
VGEAVSLNQQPRADSVSESDKSRQKPSAPLLRQALIYLGGIQKMLVRRRITSKVSDFFRRLWSLIIDYPGFLLYVLSVLMIFFVPFTWAMGYQVTFKALIWVMGAVFVGLYAWIFYRTSSFKKYTTSLSKLLILLIEITLGFSAIYMWMVFFDPNDQLDGFSCYKIFKDTNKTSYLNKDYVLNVLRLVIDCNHFSVVSATTVGYGDMVPKSHFAKLIVDFQLTYTFAIVAIGIGKYSTEVKRSATQLGA